MSLYAGMSVYEELVVREGIARARINSAVPDLVEAGNRDMEEILAITACLDEHPESEDGEMYDGPCECADCRLAGAENGA